MDAYPIFARRMERFELPERAHVRVALSGGSDSTALALLLSEWIVRHRPDLHLTLGHVHHDLRGSEADRDAAFCLRIADRLGVRLRVDVVDTRTHRARRGISEEVAARELRLERFSTWVIHDRVGFVATGHSADDQVETVIHNIVRGTGLRGLRGIPFERPISTGGRLIRPLLDVERAALVRAREQHGVGCRDDSSNRSLAHTRNRIRHELLPTLRRFNPKVDRAILGLRSDACRAVTEHGGVSPIAVAIRGDQMASLLMDTPDPAKRSERAMEWLDALWCCFHPGTQGLNRDHRRAVDRFVGGSDGHRYCLPEGWNLERVGSWLHLFRRETTAPRPPHPFRQAPEQEIELEWIPARVERVGVGEARIRSSDAGLVWLPSSSRELEWRGCTNGDRIAIGHGRHASVFELLRSAGVPRDLRHRYPLLEVDGHVAWIPWVRIASALAALLRQVAASDHEIDDARSPECTFGLRLVTDAERSLEAFVIERVVRPISSAECSE
ncbi:MAG: tRNA lysidine(34) synthetase TilS [Planctomycetes bacterium]|nr:tRNA lysidine(34) synthetase TilS [Planctomycetota bacterium]